MENHRPPEPIHVAVVGAGVLGRIYGVHLETAGARVTFVVRPERVSEREAFVVERLNGDRAVRESVAPRRAEAIPAAADAVLVCVRGEQLDEGLGSVLLRAPNAPVVCLTPLLPRRQAAIAGQLRSRLVVAMPTVAGKLDPDGRVRYWAFDSAPTRIERSELWRARLARLVGRFATSGLAVRLERDVSRKNPATTIAFFPLSVAIGAAGSLDGLSARDDLLDAVGPACRETLALARRLGPVEPAAALGARVSGPFTLRTMVSLLERVAPRATEFVDAHFGQKLDAQHDAFAQEILELAAEHAIEMPGLRRLLDISR